MISLPRPIASITTYNAAKPKISPTLCMTDGSIFPVGGNMKLAVKSPILKSKHTQNEIFWGFVKFLKNLFILFILRILISKINRKEQRDIIDILKEKELYFNMAVTKTKVIDIDTSGAVKNVDQLTKSFVPLRQQIKQLRDQLAQLEVGSEEFNRISKELADLQQKNIEITEAAKYSNRDFGAVMSSLTKVSLGLAGGISAISASISLLGGDSEKVQKALAPLTLIMGTIQSFSAIDDGIKSLQGLKNAFSNLGQSASEANTTIEKSVNGVSDAVDDLSKTGKKSTNVLKGVAGGFKKAALAVKSFIAANPLLSALAATIAAISAAVVFLNKKLEENTRVAREEMNLLSQVNTTYDEQNIRLNVLLKTAQDHNQSLEERKKATEALNKIVPEYNSYIDESTGLFKANNEALKAYLSNLKQKLLLESYEGKIKEYLQKQLEIEEKINEIRTTGIWFNTQRIRKLEKEKAALDKDIDRLFGRIGDLDLTKALDDNKVTEPANKGTSKVVSSIKSVVDALKEMKKVATDAFNVAFDARTINRAAKGLENEFTTLFDTIQSTIKKFDLGQVFTEQFSDFINKGSNSKFSNVFAGGLFGLGDVFKNTNVFDEIAKEAENLANEITKINDKLTGKTGNLTASETKLFEQQKKQKEQELESLNQRLEGYKKISESVENYRNKMIELNTQTLNQEIEESKLNKQLDIQKKYREELLNENYFAESNRNIANQEAEIESLSKLNEKLRERVKIIQSDAELQLLFADELKSINEQILTNERELANKQIELDITKYDRRKEEAQIYYEQLQLIIGEKTNELEKKSVLQGLGTPAYNTELEKQKIVVESIKSELFALEEARNQNLIAEEEYNARMLQLKAYLVAEEKKLDETRVGNAVSAVNTYVGVFQSVTGSISNLLNEQMNKYDENSEQYKQLQVANSWITTLSGSLSAFMSGIQSGIPWPGNLILAGVLGASTFATGVAQINNMKSNNYSNALTSSASSVGTSEYETEVYRQQSDMFSNVKDSKVYVLENEISSVQRKVAVREFNTTY